MTTWPFGDLRPLSYSLILIDPPWRYLLRSAKGEQKSPQAKYPTMTLAEIAALPVGHLARADCLLVMWSTFPHLDKAIDILKGWGFRYITGGAWAKQSSTGRKWAFGTGFVLRSAAEPFLIGVIGKPVYRVKNMRNLIVAPVREHSRKPDAIFTELERLIDGPRCDVFGRQRRPGWEIFGDEADKFAPYEAAVGAIELAAAE